MVFPERARREHGDSPTGAQCRPVSDGVGDDGALLFLVTFEDEKESTRRAGWIYLVASHIGAAFLIALFALLGKHGSLDFDHFDASAGAGLLFLLALLGFGSKAGFIPLHVWLPEAHPA